MTDRNDPTPAEKTGVGSAEQSKAEGKPRISDFSVWETIHSFGVASMASLATTTSPATAASVKNGRDFGPFGIEEIVIDTIRFDSGAQYRDEALVEQTSDEYAIDIRDGDVFEEPDVFRDREDPSLVWMSVGFTRTIAARKAGKITIRCRMFTGTNLDAQLWALGSNAKFDKAGRKLTDKEKRMQVDHVLNNHVWREWKKTEIADWCGVTEGYVRKRIKEREDSHKSYIRRKDCDKHDQTDAGVIVSIVDSVTSACDTLPAESDIAKSERGDSCVDPRDATSQSDDIVIPKSIHDAYEQPIPPGLRPVFDDVTEFRALKKLAKSLVERAIALRYKPGGVALSIAEVEKELDVVHDLFAKATPSAICPNCAGKMMNCDTCGRRGWLTHAKTLALPSYLRKIMERFKPRRQAA